MTKWAGEASQGLPTGLRRRTDYQLRSYLTGWTNTGEHPATDHCSEPQWGLRPDSTQGRR